MHSNGNLTIHHAYDIALGRRWRILRKKCVFRRPQERLRPRTIVTSVPTREGCQSIQHTSVTSSAILRAPTSSSVFWSTEIALLTSGKYDGLRVQEVWDELRSCTPAKNDLPGRDGAACGCPPQQLLAPCFHKRDFNSPAFTVLYLNACDEAAIFAPPVTKSAVALRYNPISKLKTSGIRV